MHSGATPACGVGYPLGAIPPFGHRRPLDTFLDQRAAAPPVLWGGTGDPGVLLGVSVEELLRLTGAQIADLVRD